MNFFSSLLSFRADEDDDDDELVDDEDDLVSCTARRFADMIFRDEFIDAKADGCFSCANRQAFTHIKDAIQAIVTGY